MILQVSSKAAFLICQPTRIPRREPESAVLTFRKKAITVIRFKYWCIARIEIDKLLTVKPDNSPNSRSSR